jgi:hypothetical protein
VCRGGGPPRTGVRGQPPRKKKKKKNLGRHIFAGFGPTYYRQADIFPGPHDIRWFSAHGFLPMVFLFPVKELGFWTNPGHWVRVLDAAGSYMYIVL